VDGLLGLWTGTLETFAERASELEILQVLNFFLSQCLPAKVENPMVRHNQLPEWQQKQPVVVTAPLYS